MDADTEYLRRIGYREEGRLLVGIMITGISYVNRQVDRKGKYWRLAFLPFDTLVLEVTAACPADFVAEIEAHAASIIARRGERYELASSGQYVILGEPNT